MFKLPNPPSPRAGPGDLSDFIEILCCSRRRVSIRDVVAILAREDDSAMEEAKIEGCEDGDDVIEEQVNLAFDEMDRRSRFCNNCYPFAPESSAPGTLFRLRDDALDNDSSLAYIYLLLCTRLNMKSCRIYKDADGTKLFEKLSSEITQKYLGKRLSHAIVFGTGVAGTFSEKITDLCRRIREGTGYRAESGEPNREKDAKLDVVAWIPFSDKQISKLILFGQCKTGTSWRGEVNQLQPETFCRKFIRDYDGLTPVRAFYVAESVAVKEWRKISADTGLMFDRCRIVSLCDELSADMNTQLRDWTVEALQSNRI